MQVKADQDVIDRIGLHIAAHNGALFDGKKSDTKFEDIPTAPTVFADIFDECEAAGTIKITEAHGYSIHVAYANRAQSEHSIKTLLAA